MRFPVFINLKVNFMVLLEIDSDSVLGYGAAIIVSLIIWFSILRWAVRSNNIVRNQRAIIHLMKYQYVKQGATAEELKTLEAEIEKILES